MRLKSLVFLPTGKTVFLECLTRAGLRAPDSKAWSSSALNVVLDTSGGSGSDRRPGLRAGLIRSRLMRWKPQRVRCWSSRPERLSRSAQPPHLLCLQPVA